MIPWWQRNTIHGRAEVIMLWVLALLMAGLFVLWATVGWGQSGCQTHTIFLPDGSVRMCQTCTYGGQTTTYCF